MLQLRPGMRLQLPRFPQLQGGQLRGVRRPHGHAYIDCATDEQFEALAKIVRGEAGYSYFEIFNSTFVGRGDRTGHAP
ncbi:MAG: hypothetical protein ACT4PO_03065 [Actinomycetota bacterium]